MARPRLQQRRISLGYTQEALAAALGVETSTVHRWETQDRAPLPKHRSRLAKVLQVTPDELARLLVVIRADASDARSAMPSTREGIDPMLRRSLLRLAVTSSALMATTALARPADGQAIADLEAVGSHLWRVYGRTEAKATLMPAVADYLQALHDSLASHAKSADARRLCELHSEALQLSGEIQFDAGLFDDAASTYALAASAAREASAYDLWASALTRYALIGVTEHRWDESLEVLDAAARVAARGDSLKPTRQWVASVQAEAAAGIGDDLECQRALERASGVMALSGPVGNGGWLRFDGARLPEQRASCLVALGHFDQAEAELTAALRQTTTPRRTAAIRCDQARIALFQHDYDTANYHIEATSRLASRTGSSYITAKLTTLGAEMQATMVGSAQASELTDRITSTIAPT